MNITSKNQATKLLKNLIRTSQSILKAKETYQEKLEEVAQLERDHFIGLQLTPEQEMTMHSKKGFNIILGWIENIIGDNELNKIANEDEFLKLCVECIFLEKKETRPEIVEERNVKEIMPEKFIKQEVQRIVIKEAHKEEMIKKETLKSERPILMQEEHLDSEALEDKEVYPKVRVPYAWKHGQVFEGGRRERKRDTERKNHVPAKEYRGFKEKKTSF
ncbi:hypothetical protein GVAV_003539 [Gurleya vavrai]